MDLSKAFDTLDHSILIKNLAHYGINVIPLGWFTSYLTGRGRYVEIYGLFSHHLSVSNNVPW